MAVLLATHPRFLDHDAGRRHPERPARLEVVLAGIGAADLGEEIVPAAPRPATRAELERVHAPAYLDALEEFCRSGGGAVDADTVANEATWDAVVLAAGAGPAAADQLEAGDADAAFLALRPPGHHARAAQAMGFCFVNHVAVTAAALADKGERVLVVDWDAHHGNGTQEVFYADARVVYVSMHQSPLYPGTGRLDETGAGAGVGATCNLPFPAGTAGDAYRAALDEVVAPLAEATAPGWVLISAGFDAHRADPLTNLGLSAGDFGDLARRVAGFAPRGRCLAFLEGGYDLEALAASAGATVAALAGETWTPEPATGGGPGMDVVAAAREQQRGR